MLLGCALISGCQTTKPQSVCDGWEPLKIEKAETAAYIARNDRRLANGIASHNKFGKSQDCWD
jgi:hypothetical protein